MINSSGNVSGSSAHGFNTEVDRCLNSAFDSIAVPQPKSGEAHAHVALHFNRS